MGIARVLFAAPSSGSGKTTIVCGILQALQNRGMNPTSFKCGPDYIDGMFHHHVLGICGYNLDSFFLEKEQLCALLERQSEGADFAVMEGVMGYYDGIAGNQLRASTYEIASITQTPVILIVDGKKSSVSIAAVIKGFLEYQPNSNIVGVILNKTSLMMADRLKPLIEALGVRFYGAVPECEEGRLASRHLGLTLPTEQNRLKEQIMALSEKLEQWIDLDGILTLGKTYASVPIAKGHSLMPELFSNTCRGFRMGVARDAAFCFYYKENLDFLLGLGCELIPFSPLNDTDLPSKLDGVLLGGGYPELYAKELSQNQGMLSAIREAARSGIKIIGECGGFLYLNRTLEDENGTPHQMAGLVDGEGYRTEKLSRFGYIELEGDLGRVRGHEFHYWDSTNSGSDMIAKKPGGNRQWDCMHVSANFLAGFPHLYYLSSPEVLVRFLQQGG